MSVAPANYSVTAIANLVPAVDNEETRARTAQVEAHGAIITSQDSSVTIEAKMAAINALRELGASSRAMGAQDALMKASWYATQSPFAKAMDEAGARFSSEMMSVGRALQSRGAEAPDGGQMNLDALSRRSPDEQKLIAYNMGFASLGSWKESLAQQSRDYVAANPNPVVTVTLSDEAKASLAKPAVDAEDTQSGAERALETLQSTDGATVKGSTALAILEQAAEARRARAEERLNEQQRSEPIAARKPEAQPTSGLGEALDRTV